MEVDTVLGDTHSLAKNPAMSEMFASSDDRMCAEIESVARELGVEGVVSPLVPHKTDDSIDSTCVHAIDQGAICYDDSDVERGLFAQIRL